MSKVKDERPIGYWRFASDFLAASKSLYSSDYSGTTEVYYFILGQCIEVALKAFLRASGESQTVLKNNYGHNLSKLLEKSKELDKDCVLKDFIDKYGPYVNQYSQFHEGKQFAYLQTGILIGLPTVEILEAAAEKLLLNIKDYCLKKSMSIH